MVPDENFWRRHGQCSSKFFRDRRRENTCPEQGKFQFHIMPRSMQLVTQSCRPKMWLKVQVTHRHDRWKSFADILKRVCSDFEAPFFLNFSERLLSQRGFRYRFQHKGFRGGWQFVAINVNKESSACINQILIRFLYLELVGADLFVILALQEI